MKILKVILVIVGVLFIIVGLLSGFDAFKATDSVVILGRMVVPLISIIIGVLLIRFGTK